MHNRKVNLVGNEVTERSQKIALTPPKKSNSCDAFSFMSLQPRCPLTLLLNISGLPPNSIHGFHIHEYGDIVSDGEFVQFIPYTILNQHGISVNDILATLETKRTGASLVS